MPSVRASGVVKLINIQPVPTTKPTSLRIGDADSIKAALLASGIEVGPDPGHDGDWAARISYQAGDRSLPEPIELVAFGDVVKAVNRGGGLGRLAWIDGGRLVLEGDEDDEG